MRLIGPITEARRLLPRPTGLQTESVRIPQPARFVPDTPATPRSEIWSLSRETASAAFAAQMLAAPKRGLKADALERERFVRAYATPPAPRAHAVLGTA